jgi:hypothetical protein
MSDFAPIVLFVYKRLEHVQATVEALQKNLLSEQSELFIFSDASKGNEDKDQVDHVRAYLKKIKGFKSINIKERQSNLGLSKSIEIGVTDIVNIYGKVIVLEDDIVTAPYFLKYMNDSLNLYKSNHSVATICGYTIPNDGELPETWFTKGADSWGWGTWKRAWDLYNPNSEYIYQQLKLTGKIKDLNNYIDVDYSALFEAHLNNEIAGWDIVWSATCFMNDKFTLFPKKSLVLNIGNDGSGTNCAADDSFNNESLYLDPINVNKIEIKDNTVALKLYKIYVSGGKSIFFRIAKKYLKRIFKFFKKVI